MGRIVIACYRPKPGKNGELKALMKTHLPRLRKEKLVTGRESIVMEAKDGSIVEVFEWKSNEAVAAAHTNPAVLEMWKEFDAVCEFVPVGELKESGDMFPNFDPVDVGPD